MLILNNNLSLFIAIVGQGQSHKVMDYCRENLGTTGGTFLYVEELLQKSFLKWLHIETVRKELLFALIPTDREDEYVEKIKERFHLSYDKNGYGFIADIDYAMGIKSENQFEQKGDESVDIKALFVIVDKGNADEVCEMANKKGAKGATIIHGRGTGSHIAHPLFDMVIEPEKEIIMFLLQEDKVEQISKDISERFEFNKPGTGILFVMDVKKTVGIYDEEKA